MERIYLGVRARGKGLAQGRRGSKIVKYDVINEWTPKMPLNGTLNLSRGWLPN